MASALPVQPPVHACGAAAVVAVALLAGVVYRLFFAPLARMPGPWFTSLSRLWLIYHEFKGDRTVTVDRLHAAYGPVVRIAPDELSFNDAAAVRDIYGIKSDMGKSDFYDMFVYYNERNTFTSLTKAARVVADKYTKSYVMQPAVSEGIRGHAAAFMEVVQAHTVCDVYVYLHYYAMDAITNHLYGSYGTRTLTDPTHRPLVYDLSGQKHRTRLYLHYYVPGVMDALGAVQAAWRRLRTGDQGEFHVRGDRLNAYGKESVASFRAQLLGKDGVAACAKMLAAPSHTDSMTAAECMDHLVAGVDTTGDALCVLMWKLSTPACRPVQEALHAELLAVSPAFDPVTHTAAIADLEPLPLLDAVIREGLRWRAPVPMTLFRVVPPGGRQVSRTFVPGGTVVGCQAYSIHNIASVFPEPDAFRPERWLTTDADQLAAMRNHFWPFSSGARHCLGHNIAMVEMKLLLASVYLYYRTRVTPGCTDASMAMDDQLTSGVPFGLKCELEFEAR